MLTDNGLLPPGALERRTRLEPTLADAVRLFEGFREARLVGQLKPSLPTEFDNTKESSLTVPLCAPLRGVVTRFLALGWKQSSH